MSSHKTSPAASMFEKVLRAFETRGITYSDVLARLRRLLATGASPAELLPILRRRESAERMPEYSRLEALLIEAAEQGAAQAEESAARGSRDPLAADARDPAPRRPDDDEVALDLDFDASANSFSTPRGLRASELDLAVLARHLRSVEEKTPARAASLEALTRSFEKAREGESAAAERAAALAADLAAAADALRAEQGRLREVEQALVQSEAAGEAARELALRESEQHRTELRNLRDSLAERDAALDRSRQALSERDARLAAQSREHTVLESALEARTKTSTDLAAADAALQSEQSKLREAEQARVRSVAAAEAARETALRESQQYRTELQSLRHSLAERDAALDRSRQALAERDAALDRSRQALAERDASLAALSREHTALEKRALEARTRAAAELAAAERQAKARAQDAEPPATATVDQQREEAPTLPARTPSTERKRLESPAPPHSGSAPAIGSAPTTGSRSAIGSARALGWTAAAVLLVAGFAWLLAHRSSPKPAAVAAVAAPSPGAVIHDCASCPGMTVLPAGRFKQGSAGGPAFEEPLHWVVIGRSIAMSTGPVTVQDFEQFVSATSRDMQGCDTYDGEWKHRSSDSWQHPGFAQTETHPVTCVSWNDAEAYANWLSKKTAHRYRLPSASEWEYAARAGAELSPSWGADGQGACADANIADASAGRRYPGWALFPCDDGFVNTSPVGTFRANAFGLTDMLGNVLQWTEDCWHENYAGAPVDGTAWQDGDCSAHELRGASWFSNPAHVRADYRDRFPADYRTSSVGIRLVRELEP